LRSAAGVHELLHELITVFLASLPQRLSDLHRATETQDQPLAKRLANALKSSPRPFKAGAAETTQASENAAENGPFPKATSLSTILKTELEQLCPVWAARQ